MAGKLYFGDNLNVLREYVKDESVDLVYLDPPFNSNASYNVLFKSPVGDRATAQIRAFEDTWHWGDEAEAAFDGVRERCLETFGLLNAMRSFLGDNDIMAYLAMMAVRLIELRRVLKSTGSLYLHCDSSASHYLKILLDGLFGVRNYRSELIWKRSTSHGNVGKNYGALSDTILFYSKSESYTWNQLFAAYSPEYERRYNMRDPDGRRWQSVSLRNPSVRPNLQYPYRASNGVTYQPHPNGWAVGLDRMKKYDAEGRLHFPTRSGGQLRLKQYLDEQRGTRLQNIWDDIPAVNSQARERLGYPTQKPLALLERIISASSNPGDVVLDPFCGCGTAIHAAEKLGRHWIGIDVTYLAIQIIEDRIKTHLPRATYSVHGVPKDEFSARALAKRNPQQFEMWAVSRLGGAPRGKSGDRGIDGEIVFKTGRRDYGRVIVSVKGGQHVGPAMVRELKGTVARESADMGVFVCLDEPTREMKTEAANGGLIELPIGKRPRIQIVTVSDLIKGPDIGLQTTLNTIAAATEAKRVEAAARKTPKPRDRKQRNILLPLGGKAPGQPAKKNLVLGLDESPAPKRRVRRSS